jgi:hypothetical protein
MIIKKKSTKPGVAGQNLTQFRYNAINYNPDNPHRFRRVVDEHIHVERAG